jgi:hypothetical protein
MQKALLWTTVGNIFGKNHAPSTLNTSFVDLEIEFVTAAKKTKFSSSPTLYIFSVSVKRRRLGWPTPSLISMWFYIELVLYTQTNINTVNKTRALLQTTGGKDEPNIMFMGKS